jgi:hypothetical protein
MYDQTRMWFLRDEIFTFLLPGALGFGLFYAGFAVTFSTIWPGFHRPMAFAASLVASIITMATAMALCVRYLGS